MGWKAESLSVNPNVLERSRLFGCLPLRQPPACQLPGQLPTCAPSWHADCPLHPFAFAIINMNSVLYNFRIQSDFSPLANHLPTGKAKRLTFV